MTFILIALGVAILMAMAKDQARRYPAPREYNDEDWCSSPFARTEYTDSEPQGRQKYPEIISGLEVRP